MTKLTDFFPDVQPGSTVQVYEILRETNIKGEEKERTQMFEGIVLARKHGSSKTATITVRKIAKGGFAVEKIYPLHSPIVAKIEVLKKAKVRRSKLYFLRHKKHKLREVKV